MTNILGGNVLKLKGNFLYSAVCRIIRITQSALQSTFIYYIKVKYVLKSNTSLGYKILKESFIKSTCRDLIVRCYDSKSNTIDWATKTYTAAVVNIVTMFYRNDGIKKFM